MNAEFLTDRQIQHLLTDATVAFRPSADFKAHLRARLIPDVGQVSRTTSMRRPRSSPTTIAEWWRYFTQPRRRAWGLASLATAMVAIIATTVLWPTKLTMAEVIAAVERQDWIHLKWDSGEEHWISLERGISGYISHHGPMTFIDARQGIRHSFMRNHALGFEDTIVHQTSITPREVGPTAWQETVGWYEDRVKDEEARHWRDYQRNVEIVDDRLLIRFDVHYIDAFGDRLLEHQVWADPISGLPVKERRRLQAAGRDATGLEYSEGTYSFPAEGPESIYDLGVPRTIPIHVVERSAASADLMAITNAVGAARDRFPAHYQVLIWPAPDRFPGGEVDQLYQSGRPTRQQRGSSPWYEVYTGMRLCQLRYFNPNSPGQDQHADVLAKNAAFEEAQAWTERQIPVSRDLFSGGIAYSQLGPLPSGYADAEKVRVLVRRVSNSPMFATSPWPLEYQWQGAHQFADSSASIHQESELTPPGTIGIRVEYGTGRRDYCLDPEHDYICVKRIIWEKREGAWAISRIMTLSDLMQLPDGQWFARGRQLQDMGNPTRGTSAHVSNWNIHITPLAPDEFPPDIFNGDKLLEEAKKLGATIETY